MRFNQAIKEFNAHEIDIKITNKEGENALYIASKNGHLNCIKFLVQIGVSIDSLTAHGVSSVGIAAYNGNLAIIKFLQYKGASLIACENWHTPLSLCCKSRQYDVAEYLLKFNEVCLQNYPFENSPYLLCIKANNDKMVSLLIRCKLPILTKNQNKESFLSKAVEYGSPNMVRVLYLHHRELNSESGYGITPFMKAMLLHKFEAAKAMFELDVNVYYTNSKGQTLLEIANQNGDNTVADYMFQEGMIDRMYDQEHQQNSLKDKILEDYITDSPYVNEPPSENIKSKTKNRLPPLKEFAVKSSVTEKNVKMLSDCATKNSFSDKSKNSFDLSLISHTSSILTQNKSLSHLPKASNLLSVKKSIKHHHLDVITRSQNMEIMKTSREDNDNLFEELKTKLEKVINETSKRHKLRKREYTSHYSILPSIIKK